MLSSCKPVQLFVNMQIEKYGRRKGFHILCTAIIGYVIFSFLRLLSTVMMVNICQKHIIDILQELRPSMCCFIYVNNNATYHWSVG